MPRAWKWLTPNQHRACNRALRAYHELVDKKYIEGLSDKESQRMEALRQRISDFSAPFYEQLSKETHAMRIASDYAHFESGNVTAYYGYEYNPVSDPYSEESEWGFEVKRDGVSVLRVPFSELRAREKRLGQFETGECLLVGLELWWETGKG